MNESILSRGKRICKDTETCKILGSETRECDSKEFLKMKGK